MTAPSDTQEDDDETRSHLEDLADGCGCAEVWEHLSERRNSEE
ncbi:MAG: hypothetical protein ABEH61_00170 [Haloarculaceae archaeon]